MTPFQRQATVLSPFVSAPGSQQALEPRGAVNPQAPVVAKTQSPRAQNANSAATQRRGESPRANVSQQAQFVRAGTELSYITPKTVGERNALRLLAEWQRGGAYRNMALFQAGNLGVEDGNMLAQAMADLGVFLDGALRAGKIDPGSTVFNAWSAIDHALNHPSKPAPAAIPIFPSAFPKPNAGAASPAAAQQAAPNDIPANAAHAQGAVAQAQVPAVPKVTPRLFQLTGCAIFEEIPRTKHSLPHALLHAQAAAFARGNSVEADEWDETAVSALYSRLWNHVDRNRDAFATILCPNGRPEVGKKRVNELLTELGEGGGGIYTMQAFAHWSGSAVICNGPLGSAFIEGSGRLALDMGEKQIADEYLKLRNQDGGELIPPIMLHLNDEHFKSGVP